MQLPIFPLNGAVLYPGTSLPLNIFENRYLEMVNYAFKKERLIGMIQTKNENKLHNIGCIGKIHSFNETSDGRYLISLSGEECFKVLEEINTSFSFRIVKINKLHKLKENEKFTSTEKTLLIKCYEKYIKNKNLNIDLNEIKNIDFDQLIKFIAMISPFKNIEKQALLESDSLRKFYMKLVSIIELEIASGEIGNTIN